VLTEDIQRLLLGSFVRPAEETGTGAPRVEGVYGYLVRHDRGLVLLDTGLGRGDAETDTVEHLVDYPGSRYDLLDGEAEIRPGIHVIPTPGHVSGHQSLVVECEDGSVVLAGQSHDTASAWSADALAASAHALGHGEPLPAAPAWMERLLAFDPKRVVFAHDAAVWEPA
jgi:glyoxylase-like metal-dependent hydrolase (beta-lactamase superfamily II)